MEAVQDLHRFLEATNKELELKIERISEAFQKSSDIGLELIDSKESVIEKAVEKAEGMSQYLENFKMTLYKHDLIKPSAPMLRLDGIHGNATRDSGLALSIASTPNSSNRLSNLSADPDRQSREVTFHLTSNVNSIDDFNGDIPEEVGTLTDDLDTNPSQIDTLYIHLLPSDPNTDLSALRDKIYNISRETVKARNIQLHVVPSDSFIGITSRQSSINSVHRQGSTSSERLDSGNRYRLPSSNDSLFAMLSKIPAEHSDDSSPRQVSSSDSDISVMQLAIGGNVTLAQYRTHLNDIETQTDTVIRE